jgi:hypothetical protein
LLAAAMMATVYEDHKDEDGFLYITYSGENTFGAHLDERPDLDASSKHAHTYLCDGTRQG